MPNHFRFAWMSGAGEWRVSDEYGCFLGSIAETRDGFKATGLTRGTLRTRLFPSREAAARWLSEIAD